MRKKFIQKVSSLKSGLLLLLVFFQSFNVAAQSSNDSIRYKYPIDSAKVIIKFDLLSGLTAYANLQLALEHRIQPALYFQHGIGYVVGYNNYTFNNPELESPRGWNFRSELRFFIDYKPYANKGFYIAPEIAYRYIYADDRETLTESCGGDCEFVRLIEYRAIRQDLTLNLKFGVERIIRNKLVFDYFFGMGPKYRWFNANTTRNEEARSPFLRKEDGFKYNFTVGFRIGLLLQ